MTFGIWFIALTGIVVNDAIILIDKINLTLGRKESEDLGHLTLEQKTDKIIIASKSRLQPVIVTTLTTVFGLLPLALQDEFWAGLWFTVVFWLIVGSTMTLFAIPVLYKAVVIKRESKHYFKRFFKFFFSRRKKV
jgi:HAE1 family hydrophobic/amphiphilic exporter-1